MKRWFLFIMLTIPAITLVTSYTGSLFDAAKKGDIAFIKNYQGDVNKVDKDGWTALMFAASNGDEDAVKALIEAGADVNTVDKDGDFALSLAKDSGIIDLLKKAGAK